MKYRVKVLGKELEVEVDELDGRLFEVRVNGKRALIEIE